MKKIVTLCFFALTLCFASHTMNAQSLIETNTKANEKANELKKILKFDNETLEDVYQAYKAFDSKLKSIDKHMTSGSAEALKAEKEVKAILNSRLKELFTEEQFAKYESLDE